MEILILVTNFPKARPTRGGHSSSGGRVLRRVVDMDHWLGGPGIRDGNNLTLHAKGD